MTLKPKYEYKHEDLLRDSRPMRIKLVEALQQPEYALTIYTVLAATMYVDKFYHSFGETADDLSSKATGVSMFVLLSDLCFLIAALYTWWLTRRNITLPFKLPKSANRADVKDIRPNGKPGHSDGILYLGNDQYTGEEIWFTNNDARTHMLYLGTTGSGKTFGLKSFSCNALTWASGYIYIDGKADTDLWSTLSAMARRFGRDDDLLIMNYMTGNTGGRVPSNTLNPFSSGSASYLTNMLVSLMPDAGGDNAMWKERAVSLIAAIMPCLVWKRDNQNIPLSIAMVRQYLTFKAVIKLARDNSIPQTMRTSIIGYLNELPGYVDSVFDDNGDEKPMPPDAGPVDTSVPRQQHGYLSMQFTRSMSSLGDDYGFIFDTQAADIDMLDVVLQRRILVVLIPALEKSGDETANLGKIISSTLKGMMGATLGSTIEGDVSTVIENKVTTSSTPFMAIFDEVGYYTAQGMAVMAAQARSLGFSLIFSAQDLPALEKRVKEEARSITANCNIKLFGKLEDPTQTKEFFEKTVGQALVTEVSGFQRQAGSTATSYHDSQNASIQVRGRVAYEYLKGFTEGRAVCSFGKVLSELQIYNSDVGHAKAMRVHRFLPITPPSDEALSSLQSVNSVLKNFRDPNFRPDKIATEPNPDIAALALGFGGGKAAGLGFVECGITAIAAVAERHGTITQEDTQRDADTARTAPPPLAIPGLPAGTAPLPTPHGGPLSWAEIIGSMDVSAKPHAQPPQIQQTPVQQPPAMPMPWETPLPQAEPLSPPPETGDAPLSWGDIMGGDGDKGEKQQ